VMTLAENAQDRVTFTTTQQGVVPAGPGKSIVLAVRAQSPGKSSNVPTDKLVAIEGPLGLQLSATNSVSTSGGTDRKTAAPSQKDFQKLETDLTAQLKASALEELAASLQPGDYPITSTLVVSGTLDQSFLPQLPESSPYPPAEVLELKLRLAFKALVVSGQDLQTLGTEVLNTNLGEGQTPVVDTLEFTHISQPALVENGEYRWRIHIQRVVEAVIDRNKAINLAMGHSPENASARLEEGLSLKQTPLITPIPAWWPILPTLPMRINIEILKN
jgi:hypothetical protein